MPRTGVLGASDELRERARAILTRNASLTAKESLTVVTDDATREVGELFYAAGWELVQSMIPNLVIQSGSSGAHKNVDSGEYPIGITLEKAAVQYDTSDAGHLKMVYPTDGTSAVPDGVAIVKDCPNQELAELFVEFVLSAECQTAQNKDFGRRPIRSDVTPEGLMGLNEFSIMTYNFDYAAANKADIVEKWQETLVG